jgi:hypothetical protein
MRYTEFERVMSSARMSRYSIACGGNSKKAMTLYRFNLRLSQELFTVISCFEIALRNAVNNHVTIRLGNDWLRDGTLQNGTFDNYQCRFTKNTIQEAIMKLRNSYSHSKLVAELGFGFWRYMFAQHQYMATGRALLRIFPLKPISTPTAQYNQTFVFNQLAQINELRNRIAHHEPICFQAGQSIINTNDVRRHYATIKMLFQWMDIDEYSLLYGLNHIEAICNQIDSL